MDAEKTGALIARIRREKDLTQKQLAGLLHISDRTVSKWERGAGFPDITLLEPLADVLDLSVVDLLQGEQSSSPPSERTIRDIIFSSYRQGRERLRRQVGSLAAKLLLSAFLLFFFFVVLDRSGAFLRPVSHTLEAGIYVDGVQVGQTTVTVDGDITLLGEPSFGGRFAIDCLEQTTRDGVTAHIHWNSIAPGYEDISYFAYGSVCESGIQRYLYISENLLTFSLKLEDGTVIATDAYLVPLMELEAYYPLAW